MLPTERRADRVVLYNISWQQFENLLVDLGESRAARVAYDDGTLEIMTPLPEHEYYKEISGCAQENILVLQKFSGGLALEVAWGKIVRVWKYSSIVI